METHRVHLHGIEEFRGADWIKVRPFHEQRIQKAIPLLTIKDICRPFLDLFGQSLCLSCIGARDYRLDSDRFCLGNFESRCCSQCRDGIKMRPGSKKCSNLCICFFASG